MKILVLENEKELAEIIKSGLETAGFAVDYVLDSEKGFRRAKLGHREYDLLLLDIMLPQKKGLDICRSLRENDIGFPIIILTAEKKEQDLIEGLNIGADDYLIKPFSLEILLAKVHAILRRPKNILPSEIRIGNLFLNPLTKKVWKNKKEIKLTLKEFSLLEYMMRNVGIVLTREQILSNNWDFAFDSFANVVDVHITNIRKKIGDKNGRIIKTVRGVGYLLEKDEK